MKKDDVKNLLKIIIPDYDLAVYNEELNELLAQYAKGILNNFILSKFKFVLRSQCGLVFKYKFFFSIFYGLASKYTVHNKQTKKMEVKLCK